ncbi:MAG: HAD family phosphatase [Actinobacteria bacterium]|nr:HAD family phosphatase [Actinomycetota bacterium]
MKAAIFDLDGTLIDSMGVWDRLGNEFLAARGIDCPDISYEVKNMSFMEAAGYYIEKFSLKDTRDQLMAIWNDMAFKEYAENIDLKKGAREYILSLCSGGIKLGLATAADYRLAGAVLRRHGLFPLFQAVVTVGDVVRGKEYPDIFLLTAQRMNVRPEDCVVFEDCLHAVKGAKKAGMRVWAVYDSFSAHEKKDIECIADKYIHSFDELKGR